MLFLLLGIGGFLYLILAKKLLYIGALFACIGIFTSNALVPSWMTNNIAGQTKRAVVTAMVIACGSLGGALSGQIYREKDSPYYCRGHSIVCGIMCCNFVLVLSLKLLLKRQNERRQSLSEEQFREEATVDEDQSLLDKVDFILLIRLISVLLLFSILVLFTLRDGQ